MRSPSLLLSLPLLCLAIACGSSGGGQEAGASPGESTAAAPAQEVQTATAAQASQEVAMGALGNANRDACRANMRSLSTAEAMYFGQFGEYGQWASIASTGTMGNAPDLMCPEGTTAYSLAITGGGYQVYCSSRPEHGSIIDGIASWQ